MDEAQAARAVARRDQRTLVIPLTVTDPTHTHTLTVKLSFEKTTSLEKVAENVVLSDSHWVGKC